MLNQSRYISEEAVQKAFQYIKNHSTPGMHQYTQDEFVKDISGMIFAPQSSEICNPIMWAIYEYNKTGKLILEDWMREFINPEERFIQIRSPGKYLYHKNNKTNDYITLEQFCFLTDNQCPQWAKCKSEGYDYVDWIKGDMKLYEKLQQQEQEIKQIKQLLSEYINKQQ